MKNIILLLAVLLSTTFIFGQNNELIKNYHRSKLSVFSFNQEENKGTFEYDKMAEYHIKFYSTLEIGIFSGEKLMYHLLNLETIETPDQDMYRVLNQKNNQAGQLIVTTSNEIHYYEDKMMLVFE